jgi:hypothetical protein
LPKSKNKPLLSATAYYPPRSSPPNSLLTV